MRQDDMMLPIILRDTMGERGWDISKLAAAADLNRATLYDNLRGDNQMSLRTALRLIDALRLSREEGWRLLQDLQQDFEDTAKFKKKKKKETEAKLKAVVVSIGPKRKKKKARG